MEYLVYLTSYPVLELISLWLVFWLIRGYIVTINTSVQAAHKNIAEILTAGPAMVGRHFSSLAINRYGEIFHASDKLVTLFGYTSPSQLVGKPLTTLIPEEFHTEYINNMRRFFKEKNSRSRMMSTRIVEGRTRSGETIKVAVALEYGEDIDGHPYAVAIVAEA